MSRLKLNLFFCHNWLSYFFKHTVNSKITPWHLRHIWRHNITRLYRNMSLHWIKNLSCAAHKKRITGKNILNVQLFPSSNISTTVLGIAETFCVLISMITRRSILLTSVPVDFSSSTTVMMTFSVLREISQSLQDRFIDFLVPCRTHLKKRVFL